MNNTQMLQTILAKLDSIDTRLSAVEAKTGENHAFIQPKPQKTKAKKTKAVSVDVYTSEGSQAHHEMKASLKAMPKAKPKAKAEPSLRQRWKEAKQFVKANGLGEAFYEAWKSFCKTHKLPKAQEKQVYFKNYLACFDEFVA